MTANHFVGMMLIFVAAVTLATYDVGESHVHTIVGYGNATHSFRANINNLVSITSLSKR